MTDDIVTLLRQIAKGDAYIADCASKLYEAVDEIEDLRAELAEFQRQYKALQTEAGRLERELANRG